MAIAVVVACVLVYCLVALFAMRSIYRMISTYFQEMGLGSTSPDEEVGMLVFCAVTWPVSWPAMWFATRPPEYGGVTKSAVRRFFIWWLER